MPRVYQCLEKRKIWHLIYALCNGIHFLVSPEVVRQLDQMITVDPCKLNYILPFTFSPLPSPLLSSLFSGGGAEVITQCILLSSSFCCLFLFWELFWLFGLGRRGVCGLCFLMLQDFICHSFISLYLQYFVDILSWEGDISCTIPSDTGSVCMDRFSKQKEI